MRFIESAVISVPMFLLVFAFLVFWYNVTGVILPDSKHAAFHFATISWMAEPDAIFDANSNWAYITTILQVVTTMFLNQFYRTVAITLTERENHKYQSTYDNSLIIKRFIFEFCDCFLPLIYFGWWELNFKMLRQSVIAIYIADELRRVACESLLPYIM